MISERRFTTGDRVRLRAAATNEVGTVVASGAILDSDGAGRIETVQVLWPVGSEPRTRGFEGRPRRWHEADDLEVVQVSVGGAA